jgi:hypothetical protein
MSSFKPTPKKKPPETDEQRRHRILKEASDVLDSAQRMNTDRFTTLIFESVTKAFNDVKMPQRQRLVVLASMAVAQAASGDIDDILILEALITSLRLSTKETPPNPGPKFEA